jgi:hypothetical protein
MCTGSPMSSTKISPPCPIAPCLQREHRRLRDRHEVADERLRPALARHLPQRLRAEHVVLHRLRRVRLHERHVLVRCRVRHHLRPVLPEHRQHPLPIAHVPHHRHDRERGPRLAQLAIRGVERRLRPLQEQEPRRRESRHTCRASSSAIDPPAAR